MQATIRRCNTELGSRSTSDESRGSQSTTYSSISCNTRPSLYTSPTDPIYTKPSDLSPATTYYPRSSTETYQSDASDEELVEEPESYDSEYELPECHIREEVLNNLRPSTASEFADFFPSSKRLFIRHDDTTYDGNMNLRVDTEDSSGRHKTNIQLFHLRMHDLKKREFSLRRYERSSGREVCHTTRKYAAERRPDITRSVSNAFASIRKPEIKRTNTSFSTHSAKSNKPFKRQDSGYGSSSDDINEDFEFSTGKKDTTEQIPTNTIKMEFSNYAQVEIRRKGAKSSKRYEFEYWGSTYTWKRVTEKDGEGKAVSYHLYKGDRQVAHIVPEMRSPAELREDAASGGWVPPCSMWINDSSILQAATDVADVVIATGLIALVDDCIKRRFHTKHRRQLAVPLTHLNMEFIGPKAIAEHMFRRKNSASSSKGGSPLRYASPIGSC